jgi:CBS-domain-containing membrane protein
MNVEEVMTKDVKCCAADATLAKAAQLMWEKDCGCMPVCDRDGRVIGMITDRDICMSAWTKGRALHELRVEGAMAHGIVSCRVQDALTTAEAKMQEHQLHRLPILDDNGRLIGIVSLADIVRSASDGHGLRSAGTEEVVRTLAAVCRPRSHAASEWSARVPAM